MAPHRGADPATSAGLAQQDAQAVQMAGQAVSKSAAACWSRKASSVRPVVPRASSMGSVRDVHHCSKDWPVVRAAVASSVREMAAARTG